MRKFQNLNLLSKSTGYRKKRKWENQEKLEIWFAPRFMVEKKLKSSARRFLPIMDNWKEEAHIGILWNWGDWYDLGWCDYLTNIGVHEISSKNLYENWLLKWVRGQRAGSALRIEASAYGPYFTFICEPK